MGRLSLHAEYPCLRGTLRATHQLPSNHEYSVTSRRILTLKSLTHEQHSPCTSRNGMSGLPCRFRPARLLSNDPARSH